MVFKFFLQNRRKFNIFAIFFGNFFSKFRKFSGVRGAPPPGPPTRPDPLPSSPRNFFLRTPLPHWASQEVGKPIPVDHYNSRKQIPQTRSAHQGRKPEDLLSTQTNNRNFGNRGIPKLEIHFTPLPPNPQSSAIPRQQRRDGGSRNAPARNRKNCWRNVQVSCTVIYIGEHSAIQEAFSKKL